jgi:TetR/AcrR family transcriptional regulator
MVDRIKEKEQIILLAARKRFARYGFSKVTMDEIADDVEMGKASLYYYFPAKENLFKAVIQQEQNQFIEAVENILAKNIPVSKKLIEYVDLRIGISQELLNLGMLTVLSQIDTKAIYKQTFEELHKRELKFIKSLFQDGKQKGEFKKSLTQDESVLFLHILQGLKIRILRHLKGQVDDGKHLNQLKKEMKLFTKIFLEGIKA